MLYRVYLNAELPAIIFVENGAELLALDGDGFLPNIRKGL
jgi:hypothetical protein